MFRPKDFSVENVVGRKNVRPKNNQPKKIRKEIQHLFKDVKAYTYIYKSDGTRITFDDLQRNPEMIKSTDLVFTNVEWDASTQLSFPSE